MKQIKICLFVLLAALLCACGKVPETLDGYDLTKSADQLLAQLKKDDIVIHEDGDVTAGQDLWAAFYEATQEGKPATVKLADYYTLDRDHVSDEYWEENKDDYPMIYLAELSYDGEVYTYRSINGQDGQTGFTRTYPYLVAYRGVAPTTISATFTSVDQYVLVYDDTVTLEELHHGLISSQMGDFIPHHTVYRDYIYKDEKRNDADEILKQASREGYVISHNGYVTEGREIFHTFYDLTEQGKPAFVRLASYHTLDPDRVSAEIWELEKDNYPQISLHELSYDGETFTYRTLTGTGRTAVYPYLLYFEAKPNEGLYSPFVTCEKFVLARDPSLTRERIERSILITAPSLSSSVGEWIDYIDVYRDKEVLP